MAVSDEEAYEILKKRGLTDKQIAERFAATYRTLPKKKRTPKRKKGS